MPGMNGLDLLTQLKQVRPQTPVVLMSGHADRALIAKAIEAGASDFIAKPIDREVLMRTVRQTLHLSCLRSLLELQQGRISRARDHHICIVEKLRQSNARWLELLTEAHVNGTSLSRRGDGLRRREEVEHNVERFSKRADRQLANLDAFLMQTTQAHRQTSEELHLTEDTLRRLAFTRLDAREP